MIKNFSVFDLLSNLSVTGFSGPHHLSSVEVPYDESVCSVLVDDPVF